MKKHEVFAAVIAVVALVLAAGCTGPFDTGDLVLEDGTVLSAGEVQRLEALRPQAEAVVASITGAADPASGVEMTDTQWEAIEAEFSRLIAEEFGEGYAKFPIDVACTDQDGASDRGPTSDGTLLMGHDERLYLWCTLHIHQHRWPWCARHEVLGTITDTDSWGGTYRSPYNVTSFGISVWDQVTSGRSTVSNSATSPWWNYSVDAYGKFKWGFFPRMPSVTVRVQVDWQALPAGSWDSGTRTYYF